MTTYPIEAKLDEPETICARKPSSWTYDEWTAVTNAFLCARHQLAVIPELLAALEFAAENLEQVAIPLAKKHGHVTSLPSALKKVEAARAKAQGN